MITVELCNAQSIYIRYSCFNKKSATLVYFNNRSSQYNRQVSGVVGTLGWGRLLVCGRRSVIISMRNERICCFLNYLLTGILKSQGFIHRNNDGFSKNVSSFHPLFLLSEKGEMRRGEVFLPSHSYFEPCLCLWNSSDTCFSPERSSEAHILRVSLSSSLGRGKTPKWME